MILDRQVLAVVPARGGSKGIPLKNLREIGGRSLVGRVGDVISGVPEIDRAVVSTDHAAIAQAAEASGIAAPFVRPHDISGDFVGDCEVLVHALKAMETIDSRHYDIIVMLQPTSPLRTPKQVSTAIRMLVEGQWDSVWTVSLTDPKYHPLKALTIEGAELGYYDQAAAKIIARQQLEPLYHRNGIAYAMTRECILVQKTIMGNKTGALLVDGEHVSIDTEFDLAQAEIRLIRQERDGPC